MPQPESPPPVVPPGDGITLAEFDQLRTRLRRQRERLLATLAKLDRLIAEVSLPKQRHQPPPLEATDLVRPTLLTAKAMTRRRK